MKKETLNGMKIPYDNSVSDLEKMIITGDMQTFATCCEALSVNPSVEAFNVLKSYLNSPDIYKRRFALEVIFNHPMYSNVIPELEIALNDNNMFIVRTALTIIYEKKIPITKDIIFTVLEKKGHDIGEYDFLSLDVVVSKNNDADFIRCFNLYKTYKSNTSKQTVLGSICQNIVSDKYWEYLYDEFKDDENDKIRMCACQLASEHLDIIRMRYFSNDKNGHIRKYVAKYI